MHDRHTDTPQLSVDDVTFRHVVGHFASGVAVVTTAVDGELFGTTVSAVSSLSMDPPMMLVCLNRSSNTHDQVKLARTFAINVLSSHQSDLAYRFAKKGDKFSGVDVDMVQGVPVIRGALAHIICVTEEEAVGGTHTVFLGRATSAGASDAQPLAYYRGAFGSFHSGSEERTYLDVRRWILEHRDLRGHAVSISRVVEELNLPRAAVGRALAKLAVDRLLAIETEDTLQILPITAKFMQGCIEGRSAIQCGVITTHLDTLTDSDVTEMREIFEEMQHLRGSAGAMRAFLDLNARLQDRIIGLAGSEELTRAFNHMGVGAVWSHTVPEDSWDEFFDSSNQRRLIDALERRDIAAACQASRDHATVTLGLVHELLEQNGGEV
ncbi:flavin reductase [Leucobacter sp. W1038]|uniref:flavin reductase n=1 Tax=Leucobacter sp. W1038 TaxID=3438281 RepID=UPI003D9988E0